MSVPALDSLVCSPDPMPVWVGGVGPDTNVEAHFGQPARGFYVGHEGNLAMRSGNGNVRVLPVVSGGFYAIQCREVLASSSTAYDLIFIG